MRGYRESESVKNKWTKGRSCDKLGVGQWGRRRTEDRKKGAHNCRGSINRWDIWHTKFPEGHYINQGSWASRQQRHSTRRIFVLLYFGWGQEFIKVLSICNKNFSNHNICVSLYSIHRFTRVRHNVFQWNFSSHH